MCICILQRHIPLQTLVNIRQKGEKNMLKKPNLFRGLSCVMSFMLIICILASAILEDNRTMVDQTFQTVSQ